MKGSGLVTTLILLTSLFLSALTIMPSAVRASTLHVGGAGPGNYTTIQSAIDDASAGDTIHVHSGTYTENVIVDKTLSLVGEARDTTIIDGIGTGDVVFVSANRVNISGFTVTNSSVHGDYSGIEIFSVTNCRVSGNKIIGNWIGIDIQDSENNTVTENHLSNEAAEIYLDHSEMNTVTDNSVLDGGVSLYHSDRNTVTWNNLSDIILESTSGNIIANNNISDGYIGIDLFDSSGDKILNNTVSFSQSSAIYIDSSRNAIILNNTIVEGGISFAGALLENWNTHTIDTSNIVNGKPIYYWKDSSGGVIPEGAGQVILANCSDVAVVNQNIVSVRTGIAIAFSQNNAISVNNVSSSAYGIGVYKSNYTVVAGNKASDGVVGITLYYSSNNTIADNTISSSSYRGMDFYASHNNNITRNSLSSTTGAGIQLDWSGDNKIYHNNFIENAQQVLEQILANIWNDGYPSGGNYWSDYGGIDECSGPNQDDCPNPDGIGDTPYPGLPLVLDGYPLMDPVTDFNSPPIATFTVSPSTGSTTTTFSVDASTSSDSEDSSTALEFDWDCENDRVWDDSVITAQCEYSMPGTYTILLLATDSGGLADSTTRQVTVSAIQNQPPTCSINESASGITVSGNHTVTGTANDIDGTVERVEVRMDDGSWMQANGTMTWSYEWVTTIVADGNHTIYARSYDGSNYSDEVTVTVVVDNAVPPPREGEESIFEQAWFWALFALIVVLVVLIAVLFLRKRKERQGENRLSENEKPDL